MTKSNAKNVTRREFVGLAAVGAAAGTCLPAFGAKPTRQATDDPKSPDAPKLRAGAATVDITPKPDVPLAGPISRKGLAKVVHDRLFARALALDDGATRLAIVVCDATVISRENFDAAKRLVHQRIGLPMDRMLMSATHSHSVPRSVDMDLGEAHERYQKSLCTWMADAVCKAVENLAPARIGWGSGSKPEHCRNRRWLMKPGTLGPNPFGEMTDRAKMGGGAGKNGIKPTGPVDPELFVLSVQHADGRPLALLGNFSIHYGSSSSAVSADYFGYFAKRVEESLGSMGSNKKSDSRPPMVAMMSNGTSGNIGSGGQPERLGSSVAEEALRVYRQIEHRDRVTLGMRETELELGVRRPDAARIDWAHQVQAGTWNKPAHHWRNVYAQNTLWLAEWPPTVSIKLQALRIDELAIAAIPCEVFCETGLAVKEAEPERPTFTISLANGYRGYLPPPEQHKLGGYTTWPAISSFLETEAEPKIRAEILRLLAQVSSNSENR